MAILRIITIIISLILVMSPVCNAEIDTKEIKQLIKEIDGSMFPKIATASITITSYKKEEVQKEVTVDLSMTPDKGLIEIKSPAIDKGKYILKSGKNLWMYFRDIKRSIRISTRDSFMGTDANNYDVLQLNLLEDYDAVKFSEGTLQGKPVLKVDLMAKKGTEGYNKIVCWIDPKERRLLQNDCYSISGTMIKTLRFLDTNKVGQYQVPSTVQIVNHIDKGRTTRMEFKRVKPRETLSASLFTLGHLESLN